jgi:hypothetical protein
VSAPMDVLARVSSTVAACEQRAESVSDELKSGYRQSAQENREMHAAIKELRDAAADFLHCESCAYDAIAMVAPRNRLRAALARFGGAA